MANEFVTLKGQLTQGESCHLLQFDGLSVPNPGEATSGAVIYSPTGEIVYEAGEYMAHGTNNTAEYTGLLIGIRLAKEKGIRKLRIEGDSQLVIKQTLGQWKVHNEALAGLRMQIQECLICFEYIALRHVLRDKNKHADGITNEVFATKQSFVRDATGAKNGFVQSNAKPVAETEELTILKDIQTKLGRLLERIQ